MAEVNQKRRSIKIRHRGRLQQLPIYFGKMLRMFIYQNDWKVLPMAALIAGLVGMVISKRLMINMEGTLMGAFALVCVCIWNGCFNSIQVICRERDVIKREHRSGMHISTYVVSHMLYQALLCLAQSVITLYVTSLVGVQYPSAGLVTPLFMIDFIISMFLITYASDMLSLWVSALSKNTTTAMTIMPFVLIFQLVFSGGMLELPAWTKPLSNFTISSPGLKVLAAQSDLNNRPYASIASMVGRMRDSEIGGTF
ncbi:MAG: ABC transporter permease, partial [Clostridia bacterium]|nr:ABC transporter permease [Clostridia bacterium]